jgi:hypothetical protein
MPFHDLDTLATNQIAALTRERDIARMTAANLEQINIGLHEDLERMEGRNRNLLAEYEAHRGALRLAVGLLW